MADLEIFAGQRLVWKMLPMSFRWCLWLIDLRFHSLVVVVLNQAVACWQHREGGVAGRAAPTGRGFGGTCEAHLSAECAASGATARIPASDGHEKRTSNRQRSPPPRPQEAGSLIERLRGRPAFARLQAEGVRVNDGLLWVRFVPDAAGRSARVGYALPRHLGSAVIRNKIRRRLRAAVKSIDQESSRGLPAGLYLVGARRGQDCSSYADLQLSIAACLSKLDRTRS